MRVALTVDASTGKFDSDLAKFLIPNYLPAMISAIKKSLDRNPFGDSVVKFHLDLFDVGNHGESLIPAVIGVGSKIYGISGKPDIIPLLRKVTTGARAVQIVTCVALGW